MTPVNNPPTDNSIRRKPEGNQKQSLITVSVGSPESRTDWMVMYNVFGVPHPSDILAFGTYKK
jgi:hypothetical protein